MLRSGGFLLLAAAAALLAPGARAHDGISLLQVSAGLDDQEEKDTRGARRAGAGRHIKQGVSAPHRHVPKSARGKGRRRWRSEPPHSAGAPPPPHGASALEPGEDDSEGVMDAEWENATAGGQGATNASRMGRPMRAVESEGAHEAWARAVQRTQHECSVIFYEHNYFSGWMVEFHMGRYDRDHGMHGALDNGVSSFKVHGDAGCQVTFYEGPNFDGWWHATFGPGDYDTATAIENGFHNDAISSFVVGVGSSSAHNIATGTATSSTVTETTLGPPSHTTVTHTTYSYTTYSYTTWSSHTHSDTSTTRTVYTTTSTTTKTSMTWSTKTWTFTVVTHTSHTHTYVPTITTTLTTTSMTWTYTITITTTSTATTFTLTHTSTSTLSTTTATFSYTTTMTSSGTASLTTTGTTTSHTHLDDHDHDRKYVFSYNNSTQANATQQNSPTTPDNDANAKDQSGPTQRPSAPRHPLRTVRKPRALQSRDTKRARNHPT